MSMSKREIRRIPVKDRALVACKRFKVIFNRSPEHRLQYEVLRSAVMALTLVKPTDNTNKDEALMFLRAGGVTHEAALCGVDAGFIRSTLTRLDLI